MIGWTLCSGIGCPELAAPLWDWRLASEIEPFPRAVLQERFGYRVPEDHNQGDPLLWGDMTEVTPELALAHGVPLPEVLVAGTPCQDFSIAGLRAGTDGERGNLTLEFLKIVKRLVEAAIKDGTDPPTILWENVLGIFSISGRPLDKMLLAFNEMGYTCDIDVLDAQYFGVPQRRKRVFIVCQFVGTGRKKKLPFFATAGATFLTETLLTVLAEALRQSGASVSDWGFQGPHCADGHDLRMKLFGLSAKNSSLVTGLTVQFENWLTDWAETIQSFPSAQPNWDTTFGPSVHPAERLDDLFPVGHVEMGAESQFTSMFPSWSKSLAGVCEKVSKSTTSTATKTITSQEIYTCAEIALSTAQFIIKSTGLPLNSFDAASSLLTALREFTRYARQTSNDLFGDLDRVHQWRRFEQSAGRTISQLERHFGEAERARALLPIPDSLRGNPPSREKAGEGIAGTSGQGASHWSGGPHPSLNQSHNTGGIGASNQEIFSQQGAGLVQGHHGDIAGTVSSKWSKGSGGPSGDETQNMVAFDCKGTEVQHDASGVSPPLRSMGHNQSHQNAGGHAAIAIQERAGAASLDQGPQGAGYRDDDCAYTLEARSKVQSVAFDLRGRDDGAQVESIGETVSLRAADGGSSRSYVASVFDPNQITSKTNRSTPTPDLCHTIPNTASPPHLFSPVVRRLMPVECARLQGGPDDHLDITYRGKPAADGPKYKAWGNGMAIPVVAWILRRIEASMRGQL